MGYGLGVFLTALGLILALAVQDMIDAIDLTMIGWILALAGVLVLVLTAVQTNSKRQHTTRGHHDPRRRQPDHRAAHDRAAGPAAGRLSSVRRTSRTSRSPLGGRLVR